jgi:hypothetical protein
LGSVNLCILVCRPIEVEVVGRLLDFRGCEAIERPLALTSWVTENRLL